MIVRNRQLGSIWTDIYQKITGQIWGGSVTGNNVIWDVGQDLYNLYKNAHIPAQNAVVQSMGNVVAGFNQRRSEGTLDANYINNAENRIRQMAETFARYASPISDRAKQGAADVTALADRIVADMEVYRSGYVKTVSDNMPYILGGVVLLLLLRKGK